MNRTGHHGLKAAGAAGMLAIALAASAADHAQEVAEAPQEPVYTPTGRPVPPNFFALNGITPFHHLHDQDPAVREALWDVLDERLAAMAEAGATAARVDTWWGSIEVERGQFEWDFPDRVVSRIVEAGLEPLPILCYNSAWSPDESPATEEERAAYGDWVFEMVRRNSGKARQWEIWNEPNITPYWVPSPDPEAYAQLLQVAYRRAKEADPDVTIVGMSTAWMDLPFIEAAWRAGAAGHMDAISFHFYDSTPDEAIIEEDLRELRRFLERHGEPDMPVLVTESGLTTGPSAVVVTSTPEEQARWMVKRHLVMLAEGLDQFYYFKLQDDPPEPEPDGWWGLLEDDGTQKPSWDAYRTMTARLTGAEFLGRVDGLAAQPEQDRNVEFQLYRQEDGELFAVAWVREDAPRLPVRIPVGNPVRLERMDGTLARTVQPGVDGCAVLELRKEPMYLRNLCEVVARRMALSIEPSVLYIYPGESRTVELRFHNPGPEAEEIPAGPLLDALAATPVLALVEQVQEDADVVVEPVLSAEPGEKARLTLILTLPADAETFHPVHIFPRFGDRFGARLSLYYDEPFEHHLRVAERGGGVEGVLALRNRRAEPADGSVRWLLNGVPKAGVTEFEAVGMEEEKVLRRIFQPLREGETLLEADIRGADGVAARSGYRLFAIPPRRTPIEIDGDLSDWEGIQGVHLAPPTHQEEPDPLRNPLDPEQYGATVRLAWDEEYLYLAAEIMDPDPRVNPFREGEVWRGDSIELFLGFDGPTVLTDYGPMHYQLGLSPGDGGEDSFVHSWRSAQDRPGGTVPGSRIASRETETGYTMEAAIPFADFGAEVEAGQVIGLDMHVSFRDDPDAERRRGLLIWNGTGRNFLDPSRWGVGLLMDTRDGADNNTP